MRALLDLLLPALCPACRHAEGPGLCAPCIEAIPRLDRPCPWCGCPAGSASAAIQVARQPCFRCRGTGYPHIQAVAVTAAYAGVVTALVTAAKAGARPAAVRALATVMIDPPPSWSLSAHTVVCPVPPTPGRRPGPHLATALATAIARRSHRPLRKLLGMTRHAAPQHRLDGHARHANVAGLFAARGAVPDDVILVDDLLTSGATITAAARALHAAGAKRIHALILARSPDRGDPPTIGAAWAGRVEE
jgi:predicted amidophosphoribosyltransferase